MVKEDFYIEKPHSMVMGEIPSSVMERFLILLNLIGITGTVEGKTRFQKLIFLAQREFGLKAAYEFQKHHYGPYSFGLSDDLKTLEDWGYIRVETKYFETNENDFLGKFFVYGLTDKGREFISKNQKNDLLKPLEKVVSKWKEKSLGELISYVYQNCTN